MQSLDRAQGLRSCETRTTAWHARNNKHRASQSTLTASLYRYRKTTRHKLQPARTPLCWLVILLTETQQDFFLDFQHDARAIPHYETDCVFRRRA